MRELHLHIGLHKTATSYQQRLLWQNEDQLALQGYTLAHTQRFGKNHHELAKLLERDGAEAFCDQIAKAKGYRLVISSEDICRGLTIPSLAKEVAETLSQHFDVKVYLFLRRQDLLKESAYAQRVKLDEDCGPISVFPKIATNWPLEEHENPDFGTRVSILEDAFGREALNVRIYCDPPRKDPFVQLCDMMGIATGALNLAQKKRNVSLTRRKTMLLSCFPKNDPDVTRVFYKFLRNSRRIADDGCKHFLSGEQRAQLFERYLPGNAELVESYALEDGDMLTTPPVHNPNWFPVEPVTTKETLGVALGGAIAALRDHSIPIARRPGLALRLVWGTLVAARNCKKWYGNQAQWT